uniref:Uncharacterized protein n=1 Tax=Rhizophora mucronata TaxID=61149 RepID=A0A2P2R0C6_RHIMU
MYQKKEKNSGLDHDYIFAGFPLMHIYFQATGFQTCSIWFPMPS